MTGKYVIGVDYGTDSCRGLLVNALTGRQIASSVCSYPRWSQGMYCDPLRSMYRQHPLDYIESLEQVISDITTGLDKEIVQNITGMTFDTTGSTPVLTDREGMPLSMRHGMEDDPDAMFILWKDHTAVGEAMEINELARSFSTDYTSYSGGIYSAEWVWAKALHVLRGNERIRQSAFSWTEHCDWMAGLLTGNTSPATIKRSRCAAGHKAMWNEQWGGLPPREFLHRLDPLLVQLSQNLFSQTSTVDDSAGKITPQWASRLGLPEDMIVGVGALDAHIGAIGAGIKPYVLTRIMGTSTCDILVSPYEDTVGKLVRGICGQVDGSVLPGYTGMEAGQSAFGDVYAWFCNLLKWPLEELMPGSGVGDDIIGRLTAKASQIPPGESSVLALEWFNGRRTPDANPVLLGALTGLELGTTAPMIFRALVEATAYGSRAIMERFVSEGIRIDSILATGGIAYKSPFVMQTLSDVLGVPIRVAEAGETVALGAAICAAVAAGIHPSIQAAQQTMIPVSGTRYDPDMERHKIYDVLYARYLDLGIYTESTAKK